MIATALACSQGNAQQSKERKPVKTPDKIQIQLAAEAVRCGASPVAKSERERLTTIIRDSLSPADLRVQSIFSLCISTDGITLEELRVVKKLLEDETAVKSVKEASILAIASAIRSPTAEVMVEAEDLLFSILDDKRSLSEARNAAVVSLIFSSSNEIATIYAIANIISSEDETDDLKEFIFSEMLGSAIFERRRSLDFLVYTLLFCCNNNTSSKENRIYVIEQLAIVIGFSSDLSVQSKRNIVRFAELELSSKDGSDETRGAVIFLVPDKSFISQNMLKHAELLMSNKAAGPETIRCCEHILNTWNSVEKK